MITPALQIVDNTMVRLAREIAINHYPPETILERLALPKDTLDKLKGDPKFIQVLESELAAWHAATNTAERTQLKAAALVEEWLPEANSRLHDPLENLNAKVELGKLLARLAGIGMTGSGVEGGVGSRFSVTINLGADSQLKFEKEIPFKAIEATPTTE